MAINRTDLKRAVHSSMSRGSPHQWNQSPYQRNYSKWWIHSSSSNVSLGHLANSKELGKTERTHWEGKFGPKLWSSHLWSGGHLFKMLVKWLSKWAEADWAWSSYLLCPVPAPLRLIPTPPPAEMLYNLPGAMGLCWPSLCNSTPLSLFNFWRPLNQMHSPQVF